MTNGIAQLPLDGVGKKIDAWQLSIGGNTVLRQRVVASPHERLLTTRYLFNSGSLVVGASADAANVGRVYVENDPDSTVLIAVTRVGFVSQHASVLATPTSPRIALRAFTFAGNTPSGAVITGRKQDTSLPGKDGNWDVRTAATGMTITEGVDVAVFYPVAALTAVAASTPARDEWKPDPDQPLILRPSEGLMVKQADAGTASDTRVFSVSIVVEEFTAP